MWILACRRYIRRVVCVGSACNAVNRSLRFRGQLSLALPSPDLFKGQRWSCARLQDGSGGLLRTPTPNGPSWKRGPTFFFLHKKLVNINLVAFVCCLKRSAGIFDDFKDDPCWWLEICTLWAGKTWWQKKLERYKKNLKWENGTNKIIIAEWNDEIVQSKF